MFLRWKVSSQLASRAEALPLVQNLLKSVTIRVNSDCHWAKSGVLRYSGSKKFVVLAMGDSAFLGVGRAGLCCTAQYARHIGVYLAAVKENIAPQYNIN